MDELDALFQQLQDVQEQQAAIIWSDFSLTRRSSKQLRLSERMVVDVVDKLKSLGLFKQGLLHTTSGREYITPAQVAWDIGAALEQSGGRIALVDLPGLLSLDYSICAAHAAALAQAAEGGVSLVNGDLFSDTFFRNVALEVAELLHTSPAIEVSELAKQFALQADQVVSCVQQHLGTVIQGTLEGSTLYMPSFLSIAKAFLRGYLRAATSPLSVSNVLKSQPFPYSSAINNKLATTLVQELLEEGAVQGRLRGSGLLFTPTAFHTAQIEAVQASYRRNGYVQYSMVKTWGISQPRMFLREHCMDGMQLHSVHAAPSITAELDASFAAGTPSCGFLDVRELLPNCLEQEDIEILLDRSLQHNKHLVSGVYLVSAELLAKAGAVAKKSGCDAAERDLITGKRSVTAPAGVLRAAPPAGEATGQKLKGGRGKGRKATHATASASPLAIPGGEADAATAHFFSDVKLLLLSQCNTDCDKLPEELAVAIAQTVAGTALLAYGERLQAGLSRGSQAEQNTALQEVNSLQQQAALHLCGLRTLLHDSGAAAAASAATGTSSGAVGLEAAQQFSGVDVREQVSVLERHLFSSWLSPTADAALRYTAVHVCGCTGAEELDGQDVAQQRSIMLASLPAGLQPAAQEVVEALQVRRSQGLALEHLLGTVDALLTATGAGLLDRTQEAAVQFVAASCERNRQLIQQPGVDLAAALAAGIVCLVGKHFHVLVLAPGRSLNFIIRCLNKCMASEDTAFLDAVHRDVMQRFKKKQENTERLDDEHLSTQLWSLCHAAAKDL